MLVHPLTPCVFRVQKISNSALIISPCFAFLSRLYTINPVNPAGFTENVSRHPRLYIRRGALRGWGSSPSKRIHYHPQLREADLAKGRYRAPLYRFLDNPVPSSKPRPKYSHLHWYLWHVLGGGGPRKLPELLLSSPGWPSASNPLRICEAWSEPPIVIVYFARENHL